MEIATKVPLPHSHQSLTSSPAPFKGDPPSDKSLGWASLISKHKPVLDLMEEQGQLAGLWRGADFPKSLLCPPGPRGQVN